MQKHLYTVRFLNDETEWRARAKRALIMQLWKQYRPKTSKQTVLLDFGCGSGMLQQEFESRNKKIIAYGIDVAKVAVDFCRKRGIERVQLYGGKEIPFKSNCFDVVTAVDVLEHIRDDILSLKEIHRVLKTGGIAILLVPSEKKLWSTRDLRLKHVRRYEPEELQKKCEAVGFEVKTRKRVDFLLYFLFLGMLVFAPKKKNIPHIAIETAPRLSFINEVFFFYEQIENFIQRFITFPVGLSQAIVVKKR